MFVHPERRSTLKLQPAAPLPLEHLDPHTPELSQLVSQWQKLWLLAVARQKHLEQHQQALKEVNVLFKMYQYCTNIVPLNMLCKKFSSSKLHYFM